MQNDQYSKVRIVIVETRVAPELLGFDILCEEQGVLEYVGGDFRNCAAVTICDGFFQLLMPL